MKKEKRYEDYITKFQELAYNFSNQDSVNHGKKDAKGLETKTTSKEDNRAELGNQKPKARSNSLAVLVSP